ncbi:imidazole glycerol phosphate synthase, glutamine amidotransferase subunit [Shewanella colwelliana]|uniref:Imidazole glycerol phosphate synthase subunit HisH n=1 Tax=Shewanella colwelliana TaxID=23 RepID=A0A1E5IVH1_SHECO|nr:imidazole glycerol phosphate synthase subunit HisH [Shewanella colwelliana]OEG74532.1 imidazole glycerol phosphate synthase, glutamine amidotransferase subunit [Shewanella colwelliana]
MIKIVDYGLGNIQAFVNVYRRLHIQVEVARTPDELKGASKIILPGVGAFDHAIEKLNDSGMRDVLEKLVLVDKVPVLGICVGMQILASSSDEGSLPGLGWVPGRVKAFSQVEGFENIAVPHMGWNDVSPLVDSILFRGMEDSASFYFLHSFFYECDNELNISATSQYNMKFTCAVNEGNVYGVQFHPEKSHHCGVGLLKNFAEI